MLPLKLGLLRLSREAHRRLPELVRSHALLLLERQGLLLEAPVQRELTLLPLRAELGLHEVHLPLRLERLELLLLLLREDRRLRHSRRREPGDLRLHLRREP